VKNCQIASLALFHGKTNLTITTFLEGDFSWLNKKLGKNKNISFAISQNTLPHIYLYKYGVMLKDL